MRVFFRSESGEMILDSKNEDVASLMAVLRETNSIKIGLFNYDVKKYKLEYYRHSKNEEPEKELNIILKRNYNDQ
ncbi:hypothetical protein COI79_31335 [Bacillus thuringiensis]|uniref:Group-specific protein n=1 Tax=Bacillus thuringiensis TaxID=1428 RepID=A0ABD6SC63_BACTU|nr:hypothetical protein [Bacillus thuringiensis]PER52647.1 hypothetical protein CN495_14985 [Bacillus thuringiensis]PEU87549.1 hypothetical protein CN411_14010 [Bacillus thuringiensis]PFI01062.1 hypothetical protein COI79_31335 [Bacillus thuringiensis]PGY79150.1 hypothetical protein COE44_12330 [Bacillus thuringiensis]